MPNQQYSISRLTPLFEYLKKQQENEKNGRIIELSITFALISFFLFFAIRPTLFTISTLVGDINSKKILSGKMKSKIDQIITAQDNFSNIQERYYLIEDALPSKPNFVDALNLVDNDISKNGVNLDKIAFLQTNNNFYGTQISTSSSFSSIVKTVSSLNTYRRLFSIPSISFNQEDSDRSSGKVNFILPINIYFWNKEYEKK